jgi:hypothetical protein
MNLQLEGGYVLAAYGSVERRRRNGKRKSGRAATYRSDAKFSCLVSDAVENYFEAFAGSGMDASCWGFGSSEEKAAIEVQQKRLRGLQ